MKYIHLGLALVTSVLAQGQTNLSLEEALNLAAVRNKHLLVTQLNEDFAGLDVKKAQADLRPSLSLTGSYNYYFNRPVIFMPGSFLGDENRSVADVAVGGQHAFNHVLAFQQPIISAAATQRVSRLKLQQEVRVANTREASIELKIAVSTIYWQAIMIREMVDLKKQSLNRNKIALFDSKMMLAQGKRIQIDTLRNFIAVQNLETSIVQLENQQADLREQLRWLLGFESDVEFELTDLLEVPASDQFIDMDSYDHRPDIQVMKTQIEVDKSAMREARRYWLPIVSVTGGFQLQAQSDDFQLQNYSWPRTTFLGLQASLPIYSGGRLSASHAQSQVRLRQNELRLNELLESAQNEVASLKRKLSESYARLQTSNRMVDAARVSHGMAEERYKTGLGSRLELTDAEAALTEAKIIQLQTIFTINKLGLELERAQGLSN